MIGESRSNGERLFFLRYLLWMVVVFYKAVLLWLLIFGKDLKVGIMLFMRPRYREYLGKLGRIEGS